MSTNFYARTRGCPNDCGHCNEATELHIGKFLIPIAHLTTYEGERREQLVRDLGLNVSSISNWRDWVTVLLSGKIVQVIDDYGVPYEATDFLSKFGQFFQDAITSNYDYS